MYRLIRIAVSVLAAAFLMASCGSSTENTSTTIEIAVAEYAGETTLEEGRSDVYNLFVKLEYPVSGLSAEAMDNIEKAIVESSLGTDYASYPIDEALLQYKEDREHEFKNENASLLNDLKNSEQDDFSEEPDLSWDEMTEGRFLPLYKGVVSYLVDLYSYSGGAHGNNAIISINFDTETGNIIEEKDLFGYDYETELSGAISTHLIDALDEESYNMLFMTDVHPNGNFSVADAGVTYYYGPYEIGPYALGVIKVLVPWDDLSDILKLDVLK